MKNLLIFILAIEAIVFVSCGEKKDKSIVDEGNSVDSLSFLDSINYGLLTVNSCIAKNDIDFNSDDYLRIISDKYAEVENVNDTITLKFYSRSEDDRKPAAAGQKIFFWPTRITLKVQFLEGDPVIIDKVIQKAKIWQNHANVKFEFGTFSDPDITISFDERSGSWSYIGVQSKKYRPSMNFGWLTTATRDQEYERVVLHEFGHALGLIHEHQNPNGNPIKWNVKKTYQYYMHTQGWTEEDVDVNIFEKYKSTQLLSTTFDPLSIMLYEVPAALTLDRYSTKLNSTLSEKDKLLIKTIYK